MKSQKIAHISFVALSLFWGASVAADSQTIPSSPYNKNDSFFETQFKTDVTSIRAANLAVQCGLLPPAARPVALAATTQQLLSDAKVAYGDTNGNISVWGASEVYQAVNLLYQLNSNLEPGVQKAQPNQRTCSSLANSGIIATLNKLIETGD